MTMTVSRELRDFVSADEDDVSGQAYAVFGGRSQAQRDFDAALAGLMLTLPDDPGERARIFGTGTDPEDARLSGLREQSDTARRHDPIAGVVRGVFIVDTVSMNQRAYTPEALRKAIKLYEGVSVYIDHPDGESNARKIGERFGRLRGVYADENGALWARELRYNPSHRDAKSFAWTVANDADAVGLSHNAATWAFREGRRDVVDQIDRVFSVDLVVGPAHGRGLFGDMLDAREANVREQKSLWVKAQVDIVDETPDAFLFETEGYGGTKSLWVPKTHVFAPHTYRVGELGVVLPIARRSSTARELGLE